MYDFALSLNEAARRLAVSARTVHRLVAAGELPTVRVGRRRVIRSTTLDGWLRGREK